MSLKLRRIAMAAGESVTVSHASGGRGVYLIAGEHPELVYGQPVRLGVGEELVLTAVTPMTVGIFEEVGSGVS